MHVHGVLLTCISLHTSHSGKWYCRHVQWTFLLLLLFLFALLFKTTQQAAFLPRWPFQRVFHSSTLGRLRFPSWGPLADTLASLKFSSQIRVIPDFEVLNSHLGHSAHSSWQWENSSHCVTWNTGNSLTATEVGTIRFYPDVSEEDVCLTDQGLK